jgi:hypothetical protein
MLHPRVQTPTSVNTRSTESLTSPFRDAVRVRVLIVVDYFLPSIGGVQTRVVPMIRELQRDGHACLVMTADLRRGEAPAVSDDRGLDVARFGLVEALAAGDVTGVARVLGQARRAISAFGPDVVHAFVSGPGVLPCLDSASAAVPLVASFTIWPTHAHAGPATLLGRVLSHASWVTANSQLLLRRLHELDPGTHARSSVLVSGNPPPGAAPTRLPLAPAVPWACRRGEGLRRCRSRAGSDPGTGPADHRRRRTGPDESGPAGAGAGRRRPRRVYELGGPG